MLIADYKVNDAGIVDEFLNVEVSIEDLNNYTNYVLIVPY